MKAITAKHLPPTNTKPRRIKVQAEGVPHLIFDSNSTTPREAAERLCVKFGWGTDLIEGTLPNGDTVFVFNPHAKLLHIGAGLANSAYNLAQHGGRVLEQQHAESLGRQREAWDEARRACK
jgi:hypothetical protein